MKIVKSLRGNTSMGSYVLFSQLSLFFLMVLLSASLLNAQSQVSWKNEGALHNVDHGLNKGYSTSITTYKNAIYYTYIGDDQKVYVGKKTSSSDQVKVVWSNLQSDDSHSKPSIAVDKNGYIHVTGDMHSQPWRYYVSNNPENINGWSKKSLPGGSKITYPEIYKDRNNELYILFRVRNEVGTRERRDHVGCLIKYNANNKTFSLMGSTNYDSDDPIKAIVWGLGNGGHGCWYQQPRPRLYFDNNNRMHLVASVINGCLDELDGGGDYNNQSHVIYAYSDDGGVTFRKAGGSKISSLPLSKNNASVVVNRSSQQDIQPDQHIGAFDSGTPVVSYKFNDGTAYAKKWNGSNWSTINIQDETAVFLSHRNGTIAWLHEYKTGKARFRITKDGNNWTTLEAPANGTPNRFNTSLDREYFQETGDFRIHTVGFYGSTPKCEIQTFETSEYVSQGSSLTDEITSIVSPSSVSPGTNVTATVGYSASTNRDIVLIFQLDHAPWTQYGSKKIDVGSGTGTRDITVSIDSNTPIADDDYKFQVYLTTDGGDWDDRISVKRNADVDCVPAGGGGAGGSDLTIRARGNCGAETIVLEVNGSNVKTWNNISTSFSNYTYNNYSGGAVKVKFTNDGSSNGCDKNVLIDYVKTGGTTYQTENKATRTGCGDSQWLWCNGNFDFGDLNAGGGSSESGKIVVRARGNCGEEKLELKVDNSTVATFTLTTNEKEYTYDNYSGSKNIKVAFVNDQNNNCDYNIFLNWIKVCGTTYQTENKATRTGCGDSQWLWCNGNFDFGSISCGSGRFGISDVNESSKNDINVYPNPLGDGELFVQLADGSKGQSLRIFDLRGTEVYQMAIKEEREVVKVPSGVFSQKGVYFVTLGNLHRKILVNR